MSTLNGEGRPATGGPPPADTGNALLAREAAIIKRAVAAAYRQQAGWTDDSVAQREFDDLAAQVEAVDGTEGCCPCCQEVTCDAGCPLEPVRSPAGTVSDALAQDPR